MADNHQAGADAEETTQADETGEQSHGADAVHSNDSRSDDFTKRIEEANSPEELAKLTKELLERGETPATDEEGEEPADNREAADGEDAVTKSGEDTKARDAEENVEEGEESVSEKSEEDGEEDAGEVERVRLRVSKSDKIGVRAIEIQRRNRDLTLDECLQRARAEFGEKPADAKGDADTKETDAAKPNEPQTVEEADRLIAELRAERRKARTEDLDFAKADDLDQQIEDLRDRRADLMAKKATEASRAAREYDAAFDAAQDEALELYDFVRAANGPEAERLLELDAKLKATEDPLYNDPKKPLILAHRVAREFGHAPKSKTSTKTSTASPKQAPAKPKNVAPIASGTSRTASTASTNKAGQQLLDKADRIESPAEMEEFLASLRD